LYVQEVKLQNISEEYLLAWADLAVAWRFWAASMEDQASK
jgi:hypothetical protein